MRDYAYYRIFGYAVTIVMHLTNIYFMVKGITKEHLKHPDLLQFTNLQYRYFTSWTFILQITYSIIGLTCEILTIQHSRKKDYKLPKHLKGLRDTFFASIIWPSTFKVFTVFWSVYLYDRELVLPKAIDKVLTSESNHVIHTAIVPVVVWEVIFRPRIEPKSHKRYLFHAVFHLLVYFFVIMYTYIERGIWIYPFLTKTYGTIYFPIICFILMIAFISFYYMQWTLNSIVHGQDVVRKKNT
ncbi:androgen-dependent TFPI-regulating protein-like [Battus philenor]|uniref:androgen-dependent TFPI-regulating protein-like n=1 Tax=Battus philenor TaxID=42288 RepID=UPI0035D06154